MELLAQLEENIHRLLERVSTLEQEVDTLRQTNDDQRQEMMRTHGELVTLQEKYRKLQLAHAMLGGEEDRQRAKNQLTNMITQLDRALETLKQ
ncbi:MAG: hypothetical protein KBS40_02110 [Bacteroidales bacterium]|nr:hypothetical protein [Bacteroidales bacterium]